MNQDEIYNLLLLILLMSNERDADNDSTVRTTRGSLNELILASMLISSCNTRNNDFGNDSDNCPNNRRNTTF